MISTFSTCGGTANRSLARAVNAFAISPVFADARPCTIVSKLHISHGVVRVSARMVGILLKFMFPETELQRLTPESVVCFE